MERPIHFYYDQLTERERSVLDEGFSELCWVLRESGLKFMGDDRMERAVDWMAKAIIDAREGNLSHA